MEPMYLSIQPKKTGEHIRKLLLEQGYTIREIQGAFGFENPQAIYKWLSGKSLPSIDNFIAGSLTGNRERLDRTFEIPERF